jgi:inhibitor of cysteine peptidase
MTMRSFRTAGIALGTIAAAFLAGGCPAVNPPTDDPITKPVLERFASGDELLSFVNQQALAQTNRSGGLFGGVLNLAPTVAEAGSADTAAGDGQSNDTSSYTTTNLQEEGVDESDIFKSNGTHFFIGKGKTLRIVNALPMADMTEVGSIELADYIDSLYLVGSKVIVLGQQLAYYYGGGPREPQMDVMMWPPYYEASTVTVTEIDVSDPTAPAIVHENELDGALVTSRLTNQRLIVVLTITPPLPDNPNFLNMLGVTVDDVLPKMRTLNGGESPMVAPEDWFHPASPNGYFTTAVVTLDADNVESVVGSVAVMANAGTIYASTEALYLTDTDYTVDNNYRETTAIHKLAFNADGVAEYAASGSVPGRLLSQFSLGEYNGYLRVATHSSDYSFGGGEIFADGGSATDVASSPVTVSDSSDGRAQDQDPADGTTSPDDTVTVTAAPVQSGAKNAVYVLGENAGNLEVVGQIEDIAPGEQLYAARFMGARGFLVTFVQIDPLFVLDLAEPTHPQIAGELELPGYSDYLHPFGDNLLIGVGRSTRESPWGGSAPDGVQLSLFDVSDLANPTLVDQLEVGGYGSSSDVSYTHKAFTFLPERGLLAIPAQLMSEQSDPWGSGVWRGPEFDGVVCFNVTTGGFAELGRVSSVVYEEFGWTQWRRAAIIDDALFAVTPAGVRAVDLADFATPEKLVLTPNDEEVGDNSGDGESSPGVADDSGAAEPASSD